MRQQLPGDKQPQQAAPQAPLQQAKAALYLHNTALMAQGRGRRQGLHSGCYLHMLVECHTGTVEESTHHQCPCPQHQFAQLGLATVRLRGRLLQHAQPQRHILGCVRRCLVLLDDACAGRHTQT